MRMMMIAAGFVFLAGCKDKNGRVHPPNYNGSAGATACEAYDANRDGAIGGPELDRVPALRAAIGQVDADHDGRITAAEVDARVKRWQDSKIGEMPVRCRVTMDDAPLADATVEFEPEPFLGSNVPPARGVTLENGIAGMSMPKERLADPSFAGVACGFYKIRVTCRGREIAACYNKETTLGCEVAMDAHWVNDAEIKIALKSTGN